jgi:2-succinyl-5-enolpyruvyl-6-hydroxy-3-cyclohexene-1-carboxylate synthase
MRDATTAFARTLVDEWVRAGAAHAVVAPGSRSAPLALALAADDRIRVHVVLDERSAAFFALGIGRATGGPAIVLCTSGTAAAELHPAVLEASHGDVPLLVCTADRPPELQGVGAPQTIDQAGLYGGAPRLAVAVPPPEDHPGAGEAWRALASRAWAATVGPRPGPVHLNLAFREPLVPTGAPLVDAPGRPGGAPWTQVEQPGRSASDEPVERLAEWVRGEPRGWMVAGWGAAASPAAVDRFAAVAGWPVLADPISGLHAVRHGVPTADLVLRVPAFAAAHRPTAVLRLGANPTSKAVDQALGPPAHVIRVDPTGAIRDPAGADGVLVVADPDDLLTRVADRLEPRRDATWCTAWARADAAARAALDAHLDADDEPFDGRIARDVLAAVPAGTDLLVASSMPVRDLATFAAPRSDVQVHANRGVNGIDGLVSTVLGIAAARPERPTVGLLGDLAFLHDTNGLIGARRRDLHAVLVIVDNDGGGIFSFLPQAEVPEHFEMLFGTPHGVDVAAVCAAHGVPTTEVTRAGDLPIAVDAAVAAGGVRAVVVRTDRERNVARHRAAVAAVAAALA